MSAERAWERIQGLSISASTECEMWIAGYRAAEEPLRERIAVLERLATDDIVQLSIAGRALLNDEFGLYGCIFCDAEPHHSAPWADKPLPAGWHHGEDCPAAAIATARGEAVP